MMDCILPDACAFDDAEDSTRDKAVRGRELKRNQSKAALAIKPICPVKAGDSSAKAFESPSQRQVDAQLFAAADKVNGAETPTTRRAASCGARRGRETSA